MSKIESGTVTVEAEEITFASLRDTVERSFRHIAESKNLPFQIEFDASLPRCMTTDPKRLQQILKNLLSNAFKFTSQGQVSVQVQPADGGWSPDHPVLSRAAAVVSLSVNDTGIGIAPEKQRLIFEAFQQADAGTARKYGGTGLGLAISRELATLLGGEIRLASTPGQGSSFTLYLPLLYTGPSTAALNVPARSAGQAKAASLALPVVPVAREEIIADDREMIGEGDNVLLIIEDDPHYARVLLGLARDKGFKAIVAQRGAVGLSLARQYLPTAITLDIFLPDMLGWTVLNNLKLDPLTRHIPVQIISLEEERQHGLSHGAFAYMVKPVTSDSIEAALDRIKNFAAPHTKRLLVVEDNELERTSIVELLGHDDIEISAVGTGNDALEALLDSAVRLLRARSATARHERLRAARAHPGRAIARSAADRRLHGQGAHRRRGEAAQDRGQEHRVEGRAVARAAARRDGAVPASGRDDLPDAKQRMLERLHSSNEALRNRRVLVVDDDARNIFALTTLLENHDMDVISATNGRQAIELIEHTRGLERGADGHHDAGDGRLRNHAGDPQIAQLPGPADPGADRQGDERRPREMPGGRRLRLYCQARQHRAAAVDAASLALSVSARDGAATGGQYPARR